MAKDLSEIEFPVGFERNGNVCIGHSGMGEEARRL